MTDKTNETSFPDFLLVKDSGKQIRARKVNHFSTDHESKTQVKDADPYLRAEGNAQNVLLQGGG